MGVIFKSLVFDMVSVLLYTRKENYFNTFFYLNIYMLESESANERPGIFKTMLKFIASKCCCHVPISEGETSSSEEASTDDTETEQPTIPRSRQSQPTIYNIDKFYRNP